MTPVDQLPRPRPKQQRQSDLVIPGVLVGGRRGREDGGEPGDRPKARRKLDAVGAPVQGDFDTAAKEAVPRPTMGAEDAEVVRKNLFD